MVITTDQPSIVPAMPASSSVTVRVQVPPDCSPLKSARLPSGWKLPVNGAEPAVMDVPAASSKTVPVKSSLLAPLSVLSSTVVVPSGPTRKMSRSASQL